MSIRDEVGAESLLDSGAWGNDERKRTSPTSQELFIYTHCTSSSANRES